MTAVDIGPGFFSAHQSANMMDSGDSTLTSILVNVRDASLQASL